jgi:pimeloyl-ACP methyl ester carboxylesterase
VQGHIAYAPTMAGHGPDVKRTGITHQECVASLIQYIEARDLRDVILVGHSWGGNIVCGAAPLIADRLQRLIFWSAFVLDDGESLLEAIPPDARTGLEYLASHTPDRAFMLPWEAWREGFMQDSGEEATRLAYSLLTPEPIDVLEAKLDQKAFFKLKTPRSYIRCRQDIVLTDEYAWYPRFGDRLGTHKLVAMDGKPRGMLYASS